MANYIYTNEGLVNADELMHYGVPGMRWGHRKSRYAGVSTDGSAKRSAEKARQQMIAAKRNKKIMNKKYNKAFNDNASVIKNLQFDKADSKRRGDAFIDAAKKSNRADKQYKAAKKAYKAAKKMANLEAKAVKQKYKDEYMKGASVAGKIYARLTDSHKYYADMMYDINNGAYRNSNATSKLARKVSDSEAKAAAQKRLEKLKSRTNTRK